jgi:hypothetical protein
MSPKEMTDLMGELDRLLDSEPTTPSERAAAKAVVGSLLTEPEPRYFGGSPISGVIDASTLVGGLTATKIEAGVIRPSYDSAYSRAKSEGAEALLEAMSPAVRRLVRQDAGFRLASVLQGLQQQKHAKLVGCAKLQSVLSQISTQKQSVADPYDGDFGSW